MQCLDHVSAGLADMKRRIVYNAMCSWAEAVALSAGEDPDFDRSSSSQASVEAFEQLRNVSEKFLISSPQCMWVVSTQPPRWLTLIFFFFIIGLSSTSSCSGDSV